MNFKILILALFSVNTFAAPIKLEGLFTKSEVIPVSKISYEIVSKTDQVKELLALGFNCKRVSNQYNCQKLERITSLPQAVDVLISQKAPANLSLSFSPNDYSESFTSESYTDWSLDQIGELDGKQFSRLIWREVKQSPARIILQIAQVRFEFLFLDSNLGSMQRVSYIDPETRKRSDYWGIVLLKP